MRVMLPGDAPAVQIVDGDVYVDGTGEPWEHLDGWAYRVDETGPDGETFVLANWFFSGPNALDGETSNATAAVPFPIGTYANAGGDAPPAVLSTTPATTGSPSVTVRGARSSPGWTREAGRCS